MYPLDSKSQYQLHLPTFLYTEAGELTIIIILRFEEKKWREDLVYMYTSIQLFAIRLREWPSNLLFRENKTKIRYDRTTPYWPPQEKPLRGQHVSFDHLNETFASTTPYVMSPLVGQSQLSESLQNKSPIKLPKIIIIK